MRSFLGAKSSSRVTWGSVVQPVRAARTRRFHTQRVLRTIILRYSEGSCWIGVSARSFGVPQDDSSHPFRFTPQTQTTASPSSAAGSVLHLTTIPPPYSLQ